MKTFSQTSSPEGLLGARVEILDAQARTVAVVSAIEARRQLLPHRTVAVLLQDGEGRFLLRKQLTGRGGRKHWDVTTRSQVWQGESVRDAAVRSVEESLGLRAERLRLGFTLAPGQEHGNEVVHIFVGNAASVMDMANSDSGTFFRAEDVRYLIREFRELVAPRFIVLMDLTGLLQRTGLRP